MLNHIGKYYPENFDSFSVVERSHAYKKFNTVKVQSIEALQKKPVDVYAYVTREINYMVAHPRMGYVDIEISHVYPIFTQQFGDMELTDFADRFYLLKASKIHGGGKIDALGNTAKNDGGYKVVQEEFSDSGFSAMLFEISRNP